MNLLLVSATEFEIFPFLTKKTTHNYPIDILISGVGMVSTAFALGKELSRKNYDAVINVGIAGSFDKTTALGSIVRIHKDIFSELGASDDHNFLTIEELGYGESCYNENATPFLKYQSVSTLKSVKSITVNTVHGNQTNIEKISNRLDPDIENMEGAAVFYAAQSLNIYSLQVRSISNFVEKRNRSSWQVELAIKNLNEWLIEFFEDFFHDKVNPKDLYF